MINISKFCLLLCFCPLAQAMVPAPIDAVILDENCADYPELFGPDSRDSSQMGYQNFAGQENFIHPRADDIRGEHENFGFTNPNMVHPNCPQNIFVDYQEYITPKNWRNHNIVHPEMNNNDPYVKYPICDLEPLKYSSHMQHYRR